MGDEASTRKENMTRWNMDFHLALYIAAGGPVGLLARAEHKKSVHFISSMKLRSVARWKCQRSCLWLRSNFWELELNRISCGGRRGEIDRSNW